MAKDYYDLLGVGRRASAQEIKAAYRKLAREYHPDVTGQDPVRTEKFKEMTVAYEALSDPESRRRYDLFGAPGDGPQPDFDFDFGPLSDIVGQVFKKARAASRRPPRKKPGLDREMPVYLTLEDAYFGARVPVKLEDGEMHVAVPAGIEDGARVRVRGRGGPGQNGGAAGDLYLVVHLDEDPVFARSGPDLHVDIEVDLFTALLGGDVEVPLPRGKARVGIPAGTTGGQVLRLRDKGFVALKSKKRGHAFATVRITLPKKLSARGVELVHALKDELNAAS